MLICIGGSEDHAFPILCVALVTARGSATSTEPCSGRDRARAGPPTWQQVVGRTTPGPVCPVPHPIRHTLCGRGRASPAMIRSRSWSVHAGARLFGPAADPSHTFHAGPHWMRCAGPGRPHGARGARERETPRQRYRLAQCGIQCGIRDLARGHWFYVRLNARSVMQGNCPATTREELTRRMCTGGLIGFLPDRLKLADTRNDRCIHVAIVNHSLRDR